MNDSKECYKCREIKNLDQFYCRKDTGKYQNQCKECISEKNKKYREEHKQQLSEYHKVYREEHREQLSEYKKIYYEEHKEQEINRSKIYYEKHKSEILERDKIFYVEHKDEILMKQKIYQANHKKEKSEYDKKYQKEHKIEISAKKKIYQKTHKNEIAETKKKYYQTHKEDINKSHKVYYGTNKRKIKNKVIEYRQKNKEKINDRERVRKKEDLAYKFRILLSGTVNRALKQNNSSKQGKSILNHLPFTIEELRRYLENKWEWWMNWDNYGSYRVKTWNDNDPSTWTWNIDHIIPQSNLPYTTMEEENFQKCWALENLRPLSAKQNLIDGATKIRHIK